MSKSNVNVISERDLALQEAAAEGAFRNGQRHVLKAHSADGLAPLQSAVLVDLQTLEKENGYATRELADALDAVRAAVSDSDYANMDAALGAFRFKPPTPPLSLNDATAAYLAVLDSLGAPGRTRDSAALGLQDALAADIGV